MSAFDVRIVELTIKSHPNADRLEIAEVGAYQSIVGKGDFKTGDKAIYIPEASVLPDDLIEALNLTGKLAGSKHNRVKAVKFRGTLSQGLICPLFLLPKTDLSLIKVDDLVDEQLGIVKYEPIIPAELAGNVWNAGVDRTLRYDIENIKKFNRVLKDGEQVIFTEKLHGIWCMVAWMPPHLGDPVEGNVFVSSKGQASKGLALKMPTWGAPQSFVQRMTEKGWKLRAAVARKWHGVKCIWLSSSAKDESEDVLEDNLWYYARQAKKCHNPGINIGNVYWRAVNKAKPFLRITKAFTGEMYLHQPIFILGEVFGAGIQDLDYGSSSKFPGFRVFDIFVGLPGQGHYLGDEELSLAIDNLGLERVPVLYRGPFSQEKVDEYTTGMETVTGTEKHLREGIVIRPVVERLENKLGRVQLKSVSEKYLLRKGETTDFQ